MYKIAALFVERHGVYSHIDYVDSWDVDRDARNYDGPYPVIAHPPCQKWGNFAILNYKRWGGEHNKPKEDGGCFESALNSVNKFGGVLEHPAGTHAWAEYNLVKPVFGKWIKSGEGWVTNVRQASYGHNARKSTWLYYKGASEPFGLIWSKDTGKAQIGKFDRIKPTMTKKEANATPMKFRDMLIRLAIHSLSAEGLVDLLIMEGNTNE